MGRGICVGAGVPLDCSRSVSFNVQSISICSRLLTLRNRVISSGYSQREHASQDKTVRFNTKQTTGSTLTLTFDILKLCKCVQLLLLTVGIRLVELTRRKRL